MVYTLNVKQEQHWYCVNGTLAEVMTLVKALPTGTVYSVVSPDGHSVTLHGV